MAHYITIPAGEFQILNPATDTAIGDDKNPMNTIGPAAVFKMLFRDNRFVEALGVFDSFDLRTSLVCAAAPGFVKVTDAEYAVLKTVVSKPAIFNSLWLTSPDVVNFLRTIRDASDQPPEPCRELPVAPGVS